MKLNHIALNIQEKEELVNFYQNILGLLPEYQFDLNLDLAIKIFKIEKQPEVFLYKNDHLVIEILFLSQKHNARVCPHLFGNGRP